MPCGQQLIDRVHGILETKGEAMTPSQIWINMHGTNASLRAIRYAITELIKQGRAKRNGQQGPVYAVSDGQQVKT